MVKKIVEELSLFKKVIIFTGLFCLHHSSIAASMPSLVTQSKDQVTAEDKALQVRVVNVINSFSMLLHKIGIRVSSLKLSEQERANIEIWLREMQESLKFIKSQQTLQIESKKLIKALLVLSEVIKGVETSLKQGLKISPEIDGEMIKRSHNDISPAELEKILIDSEKRLKGFDKIINNMNKTTFNRFYTWISDQWNTPLYSFTGLPIEENQSLYISSILKRIAIYGAGFGLIVRNLPQNYIEAIPSDLIKNWLVQPVKNIVGGSSFTAQVSKEDKSIHLGGAEADGNLYFGGIGSWNPIVQKNAQGENFAIPVNCSQIVKKNAEGFPFVTALNGDPLPVIWNDGSYALDLSFIDGEDHKHFENLFLLLQDGSKLQITSSDLKEVINNGKVFALTPPTTGIIQEIAPGKYIDFKSKKNYIPAADAFDQAIQISPYNIPSPYSYNGLPVPSELVLNKDIKGIATTTTTTKNMDQLDEKGFFTRLIGNFNWITPLELTKISFQIPVAAYVCRTIHSDIQNIVKIIPHLANKAHKKFRGEHSETFTNMDTPTETFADIVGRKAHKEKLQPIIDFVSDPTGFVQAGITIPKGWLFAGEPQTGKTSMVRAIAGELSKTIKEQQGINRDVKLFTVSVDSLSKHGLQIYLDILKSQAPCILFCDEFDLIGAQRDQNKTFLSEALQALGGYTTSSDLQELVLFIIATNRPENIDYALQEYGRCGNLVYFERPYFKDRKDYFERFFKNKMIDSKIFDLNLIAQETEGCSYGALKEIANETIRLPLNENVLPSQVHANLAIDTIVKKVIHHDDEIPDNVRRILAARYAAKAVASVILDPHKSFTSATILKITKEIKEQPVSHHFKAVKEGASGIRFGQIFCYHKDDTYELISQQELLKACKIAVAGLEGQRVLGLDYTTYAEDEQEALKLARQIVFNGIEEQYLPKQILQEKYMQAYLLVENCKQEMRQLLTDNKAYYSKLVTLLEYRKTIRMPEIKECFGKDLLMLKARYAHTTMPDFLTKTQAVTPNQLNPDLIDQEDEALGAHA